MRLDKYLKVARLIKRRTVANEACGNGLVTVNDKPARATGSRCASAREPSPWRCWPWRKPCVRPTPEPCIGKSEVSSPSIPPGACIVCGQGRDEE